MNADNFRDFTKKELVGVLKYHQLTNGILLERLEELGSRIASQDAALADRANLIQSQEERIKELKEDVLSIGRKLALSEPELRKELEEAYRRADFAEAELEKAEQRLELTEAAFEERAQALQELEDKKHDPNRVPDGEGA